MTWDAAVKFFTEPRPGVDGRAGQGPCGGRTSAVGLDGIRSEDRDCAAPDGHGKGADKVPRPSGGRGPAGEAAPNHVGGLHRVMFAVDEIEGHRRPACAPTATKSSAR